MNVNTGQIIIKVLILLLSIIASDFLISSFLEFDSLLKEWYKYFVKLYRPRKNT